MNYLFITLKGLRWGNTIVNCRRHNNTQGRIKESSWHERIFKHCAYNGRINRDEVKLWLATAEYFVELDYSFLGSILKIPKVKLKDEDSFEAFNYYRSSAWKIRGVDGPLNSLANAGNNQLYAYRYDWDDGRKFFIVDFKTLITWLCNRNFIDSRL